MSRFDGRDRAFDIEPIRRRSRDADRVSSQNMGTEDNPLPAVYDALRRLAEQRLASERPGHTLQATALVHDVYLKLAGESPQKWNDTAHFYNAAAEAMRRVLVDHARAKLADMRALSIRQPFDRLRAR